jgi:hypothetical protein
MAETLETHLIYKFTTSLTELGFQADRARRVGLALIGWQNFLFPVCGQSYWRKLGYNILARNKDPG